MNDTWEIAVNDASTSPLFPPTQ